MDSSEDNEEKEEEEFLKTPVITGGKSEKVNSKQSEVPNLMETVKQQVTDRKVTDRDIYKMFYKENPPKGLEHSKDKNISLVSNSSAENIESLIFKKTDDSSADEVSKYTKPVQSNITNDINIINAKYSLNPAPRENIVPTDCTTKFVYVNRTCDIPYIKMNIEYCLYCRGICCTDEKVSKDQKLPNYKRQPLHKIENNDLEVELKNVINDSVFLSSVKNSIVDTPDSSSCQNSNKFNWSFKLYSILPKYRHLVSGDIFEININYSKYDLETLNSILKSDVNLPQLPSVFHKDLALMPRCRSVIIKCTITNCKPNTDVYQSLFDVSVQKYEGEKKKSNDSDIIASSSVVLNKSNLIYYTLEKNEERKILNIPENIAHVTFTFINTRYEPLTTEEKLLNTRENTSSQSNKSKPTNKVTFMESSLTESPITNSNISSSSTTYTQEKMSHLTCSNIDLKHDPPCPSHQNNASSNSISSVNDIIAENVDNNSEINKVKRLIKGKKRFKIKSIQKKRVLIKKDVVPVKESYTENIKGHIGYQDLDTLLDYIDDKTKQPLPVNTKIDKDFPSILQEKKEEKVVNSSEMLTNSKIFENIEKSCDSEFKTNKKSKGKKRRENKKTCINTKQSITKTSEIKAGLPTIPSNLNFDTKEIYIPNIDKHNIISSQLSNNKKTALSQHKNVSTKKIVSSNVQKPLLKLSQNSTQNITPPLFPLVKLNSKIPSTTSIKETNISDIGGSPKSNTYVDQTQLKTSKDEDLDHWYDCIVVEEKEQEKNKTEELKQTENSRKKNEKSKAPTLKKKNILAKTKQKSRKKNCNSKINKNEVSTKITEKVKEISLEQNDTTVLHGKTNIPIASYVSKTEIPEETVPIMSQINPEKLSNLKELTLPILVKKYDECKKISEQIKDEEFIDFFIRHKKTCMKCKNDPYYNQPNIYTGYILDIILDLLATDNLPDQLQYGLIFNALIHEAWEKDQNVLFKIGHPLVSHCNHKIIELDTEELEGLIKKSENFTIKSDETVAEKRIENMDSILNTRMGLPDPQLQISIIIKENTKVAFIMNKIRNICLQKMLCKDYLLHMLDYMTEESISIIVDIIFNDYTTNFTKNYTTENVPFQITLYQCNNLDISKVLDFIPNVIVMKLLGVCRNINIKFIPEYKTVLRTHFNFLTKCEDFNVENTKGYMNLDYYLKTKNYPSCQYTSCFFMYHKCNIGCISHIINYIKKAKNYKNIGNVLSQNNDGCKIRKRFLGIIRGQSVRIIKKAVSKLKELEQPCNFQCSFLHFELFNHKSKLLNNVTEKILCVGKVYDHKFSSTILESEKEIVCKLNQSLPRSNRYKDTVKTVKEVVLQKPATHIENQVKRKAINEKVENNSETSINTSPKSSHKNVQDSQKQESKILQGHSSLEEKLESQDQSKNKASVEENITCNTRVEITPPRISKLAVRSVEEIKTHNLKKIKNIAHEEIDSKKGKNKVCKEEPMKFGGKRFKNRNQAKSIWQSMKKERTDEVKTKLDSNIVKNVILKKVPPPTPIISIPKATNNKKKEKITPGLNKSQTDEVTESFFNHRDDETKHKIKKPLNEPMVDVYTVDDSRDENAEALNAIMNSNRPVLKISTSATKPKERTKSLSCIRKKKDESEKMRTWTNFNNETDKDPIDNWELRVPIKEFPNLEPPEITSEREFPELGTYKKSTLNIDACELNIKTTSHHFLLDKRTIYKKKSVFFDNEIVNSIIQNCRSENWEESNRGDTLNIQTNFNSLVDPENASCNVYDITSDINNYDLEDNTTWDLETLIIPPPLQFRNSIPYKSSSEHFSTQESQESAKSTLLETLNLFDRRLIKLSNRTRSKLRSKLEKYGNYLINQEKYTKDIYQDEEMSSFDERDLKIQNKISNSMATLEGTKTLLIRSLWVSPENTLAIDQLNIDYKTTVGTPIPYHQFGFRTLIEMLQSMPDVFKLKTVLGITYVELSKMKSDPRNKNASSQLRCPSLGGPVSQTASLMENKVDTAPSSSTKKFLLKTAYIDGVQIHLIVLDDCIYAFLEEVSMYYFDEIKPSSWFFAKYFYDLNLKRCANAALFQWVTNMDMDYVIKGNHITLIPLEHIGGVLHYWNIYRPNILNDIEMILNNPHDNVRSLRMTSITSNFP